jgi:diguanylate cyclase (GGDEF)-like protein
MRKKIERKLQNSENILKDFAEILMELKDLVSTLDLDQLLDRILKVSLNLTKTPSGSIALYNENEKSFKMRAAHGFSKKFLSIGEWELRMGGMHEKILKSDEPYVVRDTAAEKSFSNPVAVKEGIKSLIIVPLRFEGKKIGMMYVDDFVARDFDKIDINLLSILSSFAAIAIDNALTHRDLQESHANLEKMNKDLDRKVYEFKSLFNVANFVGSTFDLNSILDFILQSATHITKTPAGSIALYDKKNNELTIQSSIGLSDNFLKTVKWKVRTGGITKKILQSKEPLVITDTARYKHFNNPIALKEKIKALMAVPLIYQEDILGILYVDDFNVKEFSDDEKNLFSVLSAYASMVIKNAQLYQETKRLAITDGLTDLYNHNYFQDNLKSEIVRTKRYEHYLSLLMLDIDRFKNYNDTYGHVQGDSILKSLARILKKQTREVDIVARYGGEEFVIILPETGRKKAKSIAYRVKKAVEAHEFSAKDLPGGNKITISIGGAVFPDDAKAQKELIESADKALYKAKEAGRNRVVFFDEIL